MPIYKAGRSLYSNERETTWILGSAIYKENVGEHVQVRPRTIDISWGYILLRWFQKEEERLVRSFLQIELSKKAKRQAWNTFYRMAQFRATVNMDVWFKGIKKKWSCFCHIDFTLHVSIMYESNLHPVVRRPTSTHHTEQTTVSSSSRTGIYAE